MALSRCSGMPLHWMVPNFFLIILHPCILRVPAHVATPEGAAWQPVVLLVRCTLCALRQQQQLLLPQCFK